ncbi:unnamed protein product [Diamesa tonsa]
MSEKMTIPIEISIESSFDKEKVTTEDAGKSKLERLAYNTSILDFLPPIKSTSNFSYHLSNLPASKGRLSNGKSDKITIMDMKQVPMKPVKFIILPKSSKRSKTNVILKETKKKDDDNQIPKQEILEEKEDSPIVNNVKDKIQIVPEMIPFKQMLVPSLNENKRPYTHPKSVYEESKVNIDESKNTFSDGIKYFTNQWRSMQKEFLECPKSTNISLREAMTLINEVKNRLTKKTSTVIQESEIRAEREALTTNHRIYPKPSPPSVLDIKAPMRFVSFDSTVNINFDRDLHQSPESYDINRSLPMPTFKYKIPAIKRVTARGSNVNTDELIEKRFPIYNGDTYRENQVKVRSMGKKKNNQRH